MSNSFESDPPKLTLAIPTYNRCEIVARTVRNAFERGLHKRNRILVVDNCSSDGTFSSLINEFGHSKNFAVVGQPLNVGLFGNITTIYRHVKTEYVCINSDEDDFVSDGIAELSSFLRHTAVDFLSGAAMVEPPNYYRSGHGSVGSETIWGDAGYVSGLVFRNKAALQLLDKLGALADIELFWLYPHYAVALLCFFNDPAGCVRRNFLLSAKRVRSESLIKGTDQEEYHSLESRGRQVRSVGLARKRLKEVVPEAKQLIDLWANNEERKGFGRIRNAVKNDPFLNLQNFDSAAKAFYWKKWLRKLVKNPL